MAESTLVDLLRHGDCEGGAVFRGSGTDSPLSALGWQQMSAAVANVSGWQRLITSPMARCCDFAGQLAEERGLPLAVAEDCREIHFGSWEGRDIASVWAEFPALAADYFRDPFASNPHGGETFAQLQARVLALWQRLLHNHRGEHLLLISHGGVMRVLLAALLKLPPSGFSQLEVPHACFSRIRVYHQPEGDSPVLVSHNPRALL